MKRQYKTGITLFAVIAVLALAQWGLQMVELGAVARDRAGADVSGRSDVAEAAAEQLGDRIGRRPQRRLARSHLDYPSR